MKCSSLKTLKRTLMKRKIVFVFSKVRLRTRSVLPTQMDKKWEMASTRRLSVDAAETVKHLYKSGVTSG